MFNVSASPLLDDAHNPAMPLTNGAINETRRCCAFTRHKVVWRHTLSKIFNESVNTNFLSILTVKKL